MSSPAGGNQYGAYLTLSEVKSWLRFPNPTAESSDDALLQRIVDACCSKIQQRLNRPVGSQECWERHDGWSGEYIFLKQSPVLELVSCIEWQSSGGPITLVESTPQNPVDGIQINYATGRIMRTFAGYSWPRPFFPGSRNIEITYRAGLNPVPPDVWMATVEWVADWWRNGIQQPGVGVALSSEVDAPEPAQDTMWRGMPHWVADMISDYVKVGVA